VIECRFDGAGAARTAEKVVHLGSAKRRPAEQDVRALDEIAKLADIARPIMFLEAIKRRHREGRPEAIAQDRLEMFDEERDIFHSFGERRCLDRKDAEPKQQVLAKAVSGDRLSEILVGRRDDPDVDAHRSGSADSSNEAILEDAEKLDLHVESACRRFHRGTECRHRLPRTGRCAAHAPL
jgi:hypothetical protein